MPLKFNSHLNSLLTMTALLNDQELEDLVSKCEKLIKDRERIEREELRQELTKNLQKAIDDILDNEFYFMIENLGYQDRIVEFSPNEYPNIEIWWRFTATLILC